MTLSQKKTRYLPYLFAICFLGIFWSHISSPLPSSSLNLRSQTTLSFSREELHQALQGDLFSMRKLLAQWQADNAHPSYERAIALADSLLSEPPISLETPNSTPAYPSCIIDELGNVISCSKHQFFLPQTELAASVMLAMSAPKQIAALPSAMRKKVHLYSEKAMDRIAQDTDRFHSERIFSMHPTAAFVARYSNPATLETLRQQGVELIFLDDLSSLEGAINNIRKIGQVTGHPEKGELLAAFTLCTLQTLDTELSSRTSSQALRALFLHLNTHWSTPTNRTLIGMLLERLGQLWPQSNENGAWSFSLDQEKIRQYKPEILIVASNDDAKTLQAIQTFKGIESTPSFQKGNIFFIDETLQSSPCQLIALTYYDLCRALLSGENVT